LLRHQPGVSNKGAVYYIDLVCDIEAANVVDHRADNGAADDTDFSQHDAAYFIDIGPSPRCRQRAAHDIDLGADILAANDIVYRAEVGTIHDNDIDLVAGTDTVDVFGPGTDNGAYHVIVHMP
jgi:hypothetical protein